MTDQLAIDYDGTAGLAGIETAIFGLLQRGRENVISMPALAAAVEISTRELQDVIKHMIEEHGIMILSATGKFHGYYLPACREDYERGRNQLIHRIKSLAKRLKAIDSQAHEEIFGQGRIDSYEG